jgi:hypothetical protein
MARKKRGFKAGMMSTVYVEPVVRLCAARPDGRISDADLLAELNVIFGQGHDPRFTATVRHMTSPQDSDNNVVSAGYVERTDDGIRVTNSGRQYVAGLGDTHMLHIMRSKKLV